MKAGIVTLDGVNSIGSIPDEIPAWRTAARALSGSWDGSPALILMANVRISLPRRTKSARRERIQEVLASTGGAIEWSEGRALDRFHLLHDISDRLT